MNWIERWRALSERIAGLLDAGKFLMQAAKANVDDGRARQLLSELRSVHTELRRIHTDYKQDMPVLAAEWIDTYIKDNPVPDVVAGHGALALQTLAMLQVFRSKFDYLIRDTEIEGRNATELAFEHLRRLIAVDKQVRANWQSDFEADETACEKRGAVHFLSHGIWAFKVHGADSVTDLVYGEPYVPSESILRRTARAIVLTEWKLVRDPKEVLRKAEEARMQMFDYASGVLGDLELKRTRYVILVGERQQSAPDDTQEKGITYRHLWLPVNPEVPSKAARRGGRKVDDGNVKR
jgi:hypothetical protein